MYCNNQLLSPKIITDWLDFDRITWISLHDLLNFLQLSATLDVERFQYFFIFVKKLVPIFEIKNIWFVRLTCQLDPAQH